MWAANKNGFSAEEFGNRLKELRLRSDYTQREVAAFLHIERSTYSYYESGRVKPELASIVRLADLYEVSLDYLLAGRGPGVRRRQWNTKK